MTDEFGPVPEPGGDTAGHDAGGTPRNWSLQHAAARVRRAPVWARAAGAVLLVAVVALLGTGYAYVPLAAVRSVPAEAGGGADAAIRDRLVADIRRLDAKLAQLAPQGVYVVVDQTQNRLYVKQGDRVLLAGVCSAGSGMVLRQVGSNRSWVFDTPRGRFTVRSKIRNPVWRKPDWAFVEEGQPVPRDPADRLEYGSLGEYALYLGDGYMIHGTLYERLLGRSVTHGCIRLGRDDLRTVYRLVPVGAPVFIY
jgi:L,D-transpeptidase YbiS